MTIKTAVITGGCGFLGKKIIFELLKKNYICVVLDKKNKIFVKKLFGKFLNKKVFYYQCNLENKNSIKLAVKRIKKKFLGVNLLVNNAAYYENDKGFSNFFEKETYDSWLKVLKVNLLAPFFLIQLFLPLLRNKKFSSIVNIGTIYTKISPDFKMYENLNMFNPASYSASKAGLEKLSKWLSSYLGKYNIRVNLVSPGGIYRKQNKNFLKKYNKKTPMGRMAKENDIVGIISFLADEEARFITGQNIYVDGGYSNL